MFKIRKLVPEWALDLIVKGIELVSPDSLKVSSRWVRRSTIEPAAEVCLFVTLARNDSLTEHSLFHARAWAEAGFQVILIIVTDELDQLWNDTQLRFAHGILVRKNRGYDFGAWACAMSQLPELREAKILAIANDSVFGPLDSFPSMLSRIRQSDADVIGTTESFELRRHFQSFLLFFKNAALSSDAFWTFWRKVRTGRRVLVIRRYETRLVEWLEQSGLKCDALNPSPDCQSPNPTLSRWRELLDEGFPYVKIALLRDNPLGVNLTGWEEELERRGYDTGMALRYLASTEDARKKS